MQRCTLNMPLCFVLRTFSTRSALVILHNFTSAERVLNVGRLLQVFNRISKSCAYPH